MTKLVKCLLVVSFVAVAGLVAAPVALAEGAEDAAAFYVPESLQVGPTTLDAGVYVVRALHSGSGRTVLVVTNGEGTKHLAALLVTPHQIARQDVRETSRLLYEPAEGARPAALRTFLVANSSFGYDILRSEAPTRVAAAPVREISAIRASR